MRDVQLLLNEISRRNPRIVMFGEEHLSDTPFRLFIAECLPGLKNLGFRYLGIELHLYATQKLLEWAKGQIKLQELYDCLSEDIKDLSVLGEQYFQFLKDWITTGGEIVCLNSREPDIPTEPSRDAVMANRIREILTNDAMGKVIAVVGLYHTCIRTKDELDLSLRRLKDNLTLEEVSSSFGRRDSKPDEMLYLSSAELLKDQFNTFTVGQVRTNSGSETSGLLFSDHCTMMSVKPCALGKDRIVAPAFAKQSMFVSSQSWAALYCD